MFVAPYFSPHDVRPHMTTNETLEERSERTTVTTVDVRCTGHVRTEIGKHSFDYSFEGSTLREFLDAFFEEYDVADMLIAETEQEATTNGWAPMEGEPPGAWRKNPEGEQTRAFARVAINGRFNEHLGGLDAELEEGDRVALMYPFMFCL